MKTIRSFIAAFAAAFITGLCPRRSQFFANETAEETDVAEMFVNHFAPREDGWVQLSPFGDFANVDKSGKRVIQRMERTDAETICNAFAGVARKITQPLGAPWYIGHPDHPRFKNVHTDTRAYGRIREMAVRHDPACNACADFANTGVPCGDHGLFAKPHWNVDGEQLIANEAFHGHSVNWRALPGGSERGVTIFRPVAVKSVGFTNEPQIPVKPAALANEAADDVPAADKPVVPPKLKLIAGFKEDEDVTMEQVIEALEKARNTLANEKPPLFAVSEADGKLVVELVNEKDGVEIGAVVERFNTDLANIATERDTFKTEAEKKGEAFANERKARATLIVEQLVKSGKIITADRDAKIEELCNAGEAFETKAAELANVRQAVKTTATTTDLAGKNAVLTNDARERTAKFEELMNARAQEFPNEAYEDRFEAVANSAEGQQLFAQMKRAGAREE